MGFWTAYEKAADWHDPNLFSKCVEDLNTSLVFVSMLMSHFMFFASTELSFCVRRVYSWPLPPRLLSGSFHNFNRIPQTLQMPSCFEYWNRTPHSAEPIRWPQSLLSPSALSEPRPSSSQACPSHYLWLLSRCWGNSGSCISLGSRHGGM